MMTNRSQYRAALLLGLAMLCGGGLMLCDSLLHARQTADQSKSAPTQKDAVDEKAIRDLIKQLGDDSFEAREAAGKKLEVIGEPALELLRQAEKDSADAEVRQRAADAIRAIANSGMKQVRSFVWPSSASNGIKTSRVAVTADAKKVVVGNVDGVRVWDIETGKELVAIPQNSNTVWSLVLSPDGKQALTGSEDKTARLYDLETGKLLRDFRGHTLAVWGAVFLAGGKEMLTASWDRSIRVWDLETGKENRVFAGVRDPVRCVAVSPDGKTLAAGHYKDLGNRHGPGIVRLWDIASGNEIRSFEGHTEEVAAIAFSPDGKIVLSAGYDKNMRLWDVATGKELRRLAGNPIQYVEYAVFTPDGKRIVSCGTGGQGTNFNVRNWSVRVWDATTGKQLVESEEIRGGVMGLAVLPDGRRCLTGSRDGIVRLWEWKGGL